MFYRIPANLPAELDELEGYIAQFTEGRLDAAALKARRVPFGCYEQRQDGTYMVRIRTTGGALAPAQLKAIAQTAERFGATIIHLTTRQEFQIHDLALENVTGVMRDLLAAGLASRGGGGNTVRNILVSPDAGVGLDEVFDPSPYAFALTSRLVAESDSWLLPRKLKIAFSNSPADTAYAQFNDIGFVARVKDGQKGFRVYVAGGMGAKPEIGHLLHDFVPGERVYEVAEAIKRLFDKYGNRKNRNAARLRFLWRKAGEEQFRRYYEEEVQRLRDEGVAPLTVEPLPAAVPAAAAPPAAADAAFAAWRQRFVQAQRQDGLFSVRVPVFLGNIKTGDALKLAELLARLGPDTIRATLSQNLRLRNIPEPHLAAVWALLRDIGAADATPPVLAEAVACTGANTCKLGICLPRGALTAVGRRLARSKLPLDALGDFRLNLSGCPNSCGQHPLADLGFFGNARRHEERLYPAYAVVAGARRSDGQASFAKPVGRIAARDVPAFVEAVLGHWLERKADYASFADYVDGEGEEQLRAIAERFQDVPDFDDDKNYYYDWGADEVFSLVGRGVGECSAGLFDLIDLDLKNARQSLDEAAGDEALYRALLFTVRALLITRGIEAETEAQAFEAFRRHFIQAGLIDGGFDALVAAGQSRDTGTLHGRRDAIGGLLTAVEALYRSMDNSLRFPAEAATAKPVPATAPVAAPAAADLERDYRGVTCPMNFVKVKLDLERLKAGQTLRVILGDGAPIANVPRSVEEEGHKVREQVRQGDVWSVLIEKVGS